MATVTGGGQTTYINVGSNDANGVAQALANVISAGLQGGTLFRVPNPQTNPTTGPGVATISTPVAGTITNSPGVSVDLINAGGNAVRAGSESIVGSGLPIQMVIGDNENITYFTNGGGGTIVLGDGNDLVGTPTIGGASFNITTGAGNDTITALSGNNIVNAGGGSNLVFTGFGNNLVTSAGNDTIAGVGGTGSASDTVFGGTGTTLIGEFAKNLTFVGGTGTATILRGTGSYVINGGVGGGLFAGGTGGNNLIAGGTGSVGSTIFGGGNGDVIFARGSGSSELIAGAGNETLSGAASTGNNIFFSTIGNAVMAGGSGNDTFFLGSGNTTASGGAGADTFAIKQGGGGTVSLIGFNGNEHVTLQGYGSNELSNALANQQNVNGSAVLKLSDNTTITFLGVSSVNSSNFA